MNVNYSHWGMTGPGQCPTCTFLFWTKIRGAPSCGKNGWVWTFLNENDINDMPAVLRWVGLHRRLFLSVPFTVLQKGGAWYMWVSWFALGNWTELLNMAHSYFDLPMLVNQRVFLFIYLSYIYTPMWGLPYLGVPQSRWFIVEIPLRFEDTTIWGSPHIYFYVV